MRCSCRRRKMLGALVHSLCSHDARQSVMILMFRLEWTRSNKQHARRYGRQRHGTRETDLNYSACNCCNYDQAEGDPTPATIRRVVTCGFLCTSQGRRRRSSSWNQCPTALPRRRKKTINSWNPGRYPSIRNAPKLNHDLRYSLHLVSGLGSGTASHSLGQNQERNLHKPRVLWRCAWTEDSGQRSVVAAFNCDDAGEQRSISFPFVCRPLSRPFLGVCDRKWFIDCCIGDHRSVPRQYINCWRVRKIETCTWWPWPDGT